MARPGETWGPERLVVLLGQQRHRRWAAGWLAARGRCFSTRGGLCASPVGRSVGRCPWAACFLPSQAFARCPCWFGWPSRSAHVLLPALHSSGFVTYRSRGLLDGAVSWIFSGSFRPPCPVPSRPQIPYQVWLIWREKGGNVLGVGYGGLMWVLVGGARATRRPFPTERPVELIGDRPAGRSH